MLVLFGQSLLLGALLIAAAVLVVYFVFLLPPRHPKNIPAIPFWVALIPFFKDVDQSDIFRIYIEKPLRTHGAVKIFFGAQWNILLHRPSYLAQLFKDEDLYQKSGNHQKIPHSVLADFLGENIISAHGSVWRDFRSVVQPALQRKFEVDIIIKNARRLCELLRVAQDKAGESGVPVQDLLQRYSVANCSEVLLQTNLYALDSETARINVLQTAVKREIFQPIFMNFPFLDRLPFPSRKRARQKVHSFKNELKRALVTSHVSEKGTSDGPTSADHDKLGMRLLGAKVTHGWNDQKLLDNLTVTFVAGQENPQLCMISTLYLLAKHPEAQERIYQELLQDKISVPGPRADGVDGNWAFLSDSNHDGMPYTTSVIYESLRLFPPIGQLINRRVTGKDAILADASSGTEIVIPRGTYVGYNCYSTNRDPESWGRTTATNNSQSRSSTSTSSSATAAGNDADTFDPGRWGDTPEQIRREYRQRRLRAHFVSFHGGRRACLGEKFAMLEMRATLAVLVSSYRWTLAPDWCERMTPAGPLYPRALRLVFKPRGNVAIGERIDG